MAVVNFAVARRVFDVFAVRDPPRADVVLSAYIPLMFLPHALREMGYFPTRTMLLQFKQRVVSGKCQPYSTVSMRTQSQNTRTTRPATREKEKEQEGEDSRVDEGRIHYGAFLEVCKVCVETMAQQAYVNDLHAGAEALDIHGSARLTRDEFRMLVFSTANYLSFGEVEAILDVLDPAHRDQISLLVLHNMLSLIIDGCGGDLLRMKESYRRAVRIAETADIRNAQRNDDSVTTTHRTTGAAGGGEDETNQQTHFSVRAPCASHTTSSCKPRAFSAIQARLPWNRGSSSSSATCMHRKGSLQSTGSATATSTCMHIQSNSVQALSQRGSECGIVVPQQQRGGVELVTATESCRPDTRSPASDPSSRQDCNSSCHRESDGSQCRLDTCVHSIIDKTTATSPEEERGHTGEASVDVTTANHTTHSDAMNEPHEVCCLTYKDSKNDESSIALLRGVRKQHAQKCCVTM